MVNRSGRSDQPHGYRSSANQPRPGYATSPLAETAGASSPINLEDPLWPDRDLAFAGAGYALNPFPYDSCFAVTRRLRCRSVHSLAISGGPAELGEALKTWPGSTVCGA